MYNLLGYRVAENPDFRLSAWGLPASPVLPQAAPADDRIQAPAAAAPGDEWIYTRTLPYPSLIQDPPQALAADLPLPSESPYLGVGGLLQFDLPGRTSSAIASSASLRVRKALPIFRPAHPLDRATPTA